MAQEAGFFRDAGLDVSITEPTDPAAPIKQVAAGQSDLAISYEPEVLRARDEGLDVVAVAALVDEPLTSLIWLPESKIGGVADLRGKTVATAGIPYQDGYLDTITERAGLAEGDVQTVSVGLGLLPALLSGRADAMLGGFRNVEGVDLQLRGRKPTITPVDELGVPSYDELVLVANSEQVAEDPEPLRLFLAALERGTRAAAESPQAATSALLAASPGLDPRLTTAEVLATLPLLAPREGEQFGRLDERRWETFIAWMRDNGLIESLLPAGEAITNELLPRGIPK
jgi:putative hydroxymethylpyrimidine transport system substrate-binding protein